MDLTADNEESRHLQTQLKKWDRKRKKMVIVDKVCINIFSRIIFPYRVRNDIIYYKFAFCCTTQNPKAGKIRTESGVWIPATYKTNRYNVWKEKSKIDEQANEDDSEEESPQTQKCKLAYLYQYYIYRYCILCYYVYIISILFIFRYTKKCTRFMCF